MAAAIGNLIAGGSWDLACWLLGKGAVFELLGMLGGIAFGLVFMNSALAIVLYFVLPTVWAILGETIHALDKPADWLDLSRTTEPLARRQPDRHAVGAARDVGRGLGRPRVAYRTLALAAYRAEVEFAPMGGYPRARALVLAVSSPLVAPRRAHGPATLTTACGRR